MDNDYSQQFMQNLRNPPVWQSPSNNGGSGGSKMPLIISIILASVLFFETIALIIMGTNNSTLASKVYAEDQTEDIEEETSTSDSEELDYIYEDDNLVAFNATCKSEDGHIYSFSTDKNYKLTDSNSQPISAGTYTIIKDSVISLGNNRGDSRTVFYDGFIIVDGETIYDCEEFTDESEDTN